MPWSCNTIHLYAISCGKEIQGYLNLLVINSIPHPGMQLYYRLLQMPQQNLSILTWCSASLFWNGSQNNIFPSLTWFVLPSGIYWQTFPLGRLGLSQRIPPPQPSGCRVKPSPWLLVSHGRRGGRRGDRLPRGGMQSVPGMGKEEIREKKGTGFTLPMN